MIKKKQSHFFDQLQIMNNHSVVDVLSPPLDSKVEPKHHRLFVGASPVCSVCLCVRVCVCMSCVHPSVCVLPDLSASACLH